MAAFLAVLTPEADPVVGPLRAQWDPSAKRGLGAHITLRYPFLQLAHLARGDLDRLAAAVGSVRSFGYELARVSRLPTTLCLDPEPQEPFAAVRAAIEHAFGDRLTADRFARYIPHLSVARNVRWPAVAVLEQLRTALAGGPIQARCSDVVLLDRHGGPWQVQQRFALGG